MKTVSTMALALALGLGGATIVAAPAVAAKKEPAAPKANYSPKVVANDKAVQDAIKAKNWDAAKAAVATSEGEIKSDDDKLIVGNYYLTIGRETQDQALLSKGVDLMLASGRAPADNVAKLYFVQGQLAYQAKDYQKALTAMQQAQKAGSTDDDLLPIEVESMAHVGQTLTALQALNAGIDANVAANRPVPKEWFPRGYNLVVTVKPTDPNFAAVRDQGNELTRKWVAVESTPTVWHDVLLLYSDNARGDVELANDTRRLMLATGALKGANDYLEYAEAVYSKNPGEAKMVLDEGVKKGAYTFASNRNANEINQIVSGKVSADRASLAASEKAARANPAARVAVATADGYLSYGDYAKAADLYKAALTKTGADADLINTRIGIALAKSGDKEGAKAAFAQVSGKRKPLAGYWTAYIDHPPVAA